MPGYVARYWDLMALAGKAPGQGHRRRRRSCKDRPGFEVELLTRGSIPEDPYTTDRHEVLMVMRGHWRLGWDGGEASSRPATPAPCPRASRHASRRR